MALTEMQKDLIGALKLRGVSRGITCAISLTLETREEQVLMLGYVLKHEDATEEELLDEARIIAAKAEEQANRKG